VDCIGRPYPAATVGASDRKGSRTAGYQVASKRGSASLSVQRFSLCGHKAGFEQIEIGAAVHLALDELQAVDPTFDLAA
jgi:hypothetical protein